MRDPRPVLRNYFIIPFKIIFVSFSCVKSQNVCLKRKVTNTTHTTFQHHEILCSNIKTSGFYPDSGFFRIFFKSRCSLDHSVKLLLNKLCHILISLGGDRARIRYVVTLHTRHTQRRGFIY